MPATQRRHHLHHHMVVRQTANRQTDVRQIEIENDVSIGMKVLDTLIAELERAGFEFRQIGLVELAFVEALINAVRHGNQNDSSKSVRIEYRIESDELWLSIEDDGDGFRLDEVADPTLPDNQHRTGGRGLLLMKSLMSGVEFNEQGNRIVLRQSKMARPRMTFAGGDGI